MKRARYRSNAAKNNASQTLYEQERNRLLAYSFPKDGPLHLEMFMQLEALFVLALEIGGPDLKASRANCLLSGSYLIRPDVCGHDEYLMQNARRKMQRLASSGTLTKALAGYEDKRYEGFRAFDIVEDKPVLRERCVERYAAYLDFIQTPDAPAKSPVFARAGERYRYYAKPEASATDAPGRLIDATVRIPARVPDAVFTELPALPETSRPPIEVTLDELIAAADTVAEKSGADRSYYAAVLRNIQEKGLLKQMNVEASGQAAESVVFDKVTSLVGLVGAGKSVLVDMLTVALAHRGCKTLMMLNSVADVMAAVDFFRSLGLSTSPLVSRNARLDRLGELFAQGDDMLLPESMAHYLETPCLIDGLASGSDEACSYGDTPCFSLRAADGRKLHVCPYWGVCPSQAMARDALTSDIVVTTPAGFAMMTVGPDRLPFFEAALRRFDVMFVDEVDRVQVQLDTLFAPEIDFQQFIRDSADYVSKCMKRSSDEKMRDMNVERHNNLRHRADLIDMELHVGHSRPYIESWDPVQNATFTSWSLLQALADEGLPAPIEDDLKQRISYGKAGIELTEAIILAGTELDSDNHGQVYANALDRYVASRLGEGFVLEDATKARLSFTLKVISFDDFLRDLADSFDALSFKDEPMSELYSFISYSHARPQRYLSRSLTGNMYGLRVTDKNSLILFRQYAFGRTFINATPWLELASDGSPLGPHTMLLSGSSYAPKSLQYHVNRPVDYVLEADPGKAGKLMDSRVEDLGIAQRVSGSDMKDRAANLNRVMRCLVETLDLELRKDGAGKALVVVNSYDQAEQARQTLESAFRESGLGYGVAALSRSSTGESDTCVPRSEVARFHGHPASVLIAPAKAIERGYNIVDETGHAAFTTVVFAVRPMEVPYDVAARCRRLNGLMEARIGEFPAQPFEFADSLHRESWRQWHRLGRADGTTLASLASLGLECVRDDIVATMLATIVQVFGRLTRLSDPDRPAPTVYFADAAFRGPFDTNAPAFRTLDELRAYMEWLMVESPQPDVARALYGPFYEAFKKGVH